MTESNRESSENRSKISSHSHSRGQLILIGVIVIGALLISMTVVMNEFIYAQNVESEGVSTEADEIRSLQHMIDMEYGELLIASNRYDPVPQENYSAAIKEARTAIRTQEATSQGQILHVSETGKIEGTLLRQTEKRTFSGTNNSQWNITTTDVRRFQVAIDTSSLEAIDSINQSELSDTFHIVVEDDTGTTWTLYLATENGSEIVIAVDNGDGPMNRYEADVSSRSVTIDVVTGSVDRAESEQIDEVSVYEDGFASNLGDTSTQTISFKNPNQVRGEYTLTVPNSPDSDLPMINGSSSQQKDVIYESQLKVTYESADHYYSDEIHIAPCSQSTTRCLRYIQMPGDS